LWRRLIFIVCAMKIVNIRTQGKLKLCPVLFSKDGSIAELPSSYLKAKAETNKHPLPVILLYADHIKGFCEHLEGLGVYQGYTVDDILCGISRTVISAYLVLLKGQGLEAAYIRLRETIIKGLFVWLASSEGGRVRKSSGFENTGLDTPKPKRKRPRYVTQEQVCKLLEGMYWESHRCAVHTLYDLGLRVSELIRITKDDIDELEGLPAELAYLPLTVRGSKGRAGVPKERTVIITRAMYSRIKKYHSSSRYRFAYCKDAKPAFLNSFGKPITVKGIQKLIADTAKRVGFKPRTVSPHRLRHGTALTFLTGELGDDHVQKLILIKEQLGHEFLSTTNIYAGVSPMLFVDELGVKYVKPRYIEASKIYQATYLSRSKEKK
ncbi:tyrosine-type recombinase/integrase, partial [Pseudomonas juntendi]